MAATSSQVEPASAESVHFLGFQDFGDFGAVVFEPHYFDALPPSSGKVFTTIQIREVIKKFVQRLSFLFLLALCLYFFKRNIYRVFLLVRPKNA